MGALRSACYICFMLRKGYFSPLAPVNFMAGLSDGLILPVIPFALLLIRFGNTVPGFLSAILFLAACGGMAYGLARYLGEKEEIRHHHPELAGNELEKDALRLKQIGIDESLAAGIMQQVDREQMQWLQEINENNMDWTLPDAARARYSGWQTGLGFAAGTVLALVPFLLLHLERYGILLFLAVMLTSWGLMGWVKGAWIGKNRVTQAGAQVTKGLLMLILLALLLKCFPQPSVFLPFNQLSGN